MPYYCTVPRCTSMAGKAKNVSFHQFPRDEELAKLWNKILKRGKPYTKYSKVCSLHFKAEDYMITSVGKHKGQWRSLRKDAIPSQNLPSDSPSPHVRTRNTGAWLPDNVPANIMDPRMQQQMAQVIYVQTMLAMHAAGASDQHNANNICNGSQQTNEDNPPHTSTEQPTSDVQSNGVEHIEADSERSSFKCSECLKCFKDPDVFILHSRVHNRAKDSSGSEKENVNLNGTKQEKANPILANLLKASTSEVSTFDANVLSIENHIMAGLAVNMESYIRNISMFPITPFHLLQQGLGEPNGSDSDQDLHDSMDSIDSNRVLNDSTDSTDTNSLVIDETV